MTDINDMTDEQLIFWNEYCIEAGIDPEESYVEASIAGNYEIANDLLQLYLDGKKSAGSGLVKDYEMAGDDLPKIGNYWVILDADDLPRCIVKTINVEIHKFSHVPSYVAEAEGEGDSSLEYWRNAHIKFFTPYLVELGIDSIEDAEIVTEFYEVVFKK